MSGRADQLKGRVKEAAGTLTGDKNLESEGKADRRVGTVKQTLDHGKAKVEELIDKARDTGEEAVGKIRGDARSK